MSPGNPVPGDADDSGWQDQLGQEARERIVTLIRHETAGYPQPVSSRPPGRRPKPRRARRLIASAGAVLAVLAVVAGLTLAGSSTGSGPARIGALPVLSPAALRSLFGTGTGTGTGTGAGAAAPPPAYFIGLAGNGPAGPLTVYRAATGRVVATLRPPSGLTFMATAATADERAFVVAAIPAKSGCGTWLYRLRLTADGQPQLSPLAVPRVAGSILANTGLAASADGRVVAYSAGHCAGGNGWIGVVNLAARQVRTWSLRSEGVISMSLSADGALLGFNDSTTVVGDGSVRVLRTGSPPGPVTERAHVVLPAPWGAIGQSQAGQQIVLSPSGGVMLACTSVGHAPSSTRLVVYDASTGRLIGLLHTWPEPYISPCAMSAAPRGRYLLVTGIRARDLTRVDLMTGRVRQVKASWRFPPAALSW
jgi:hypothetical protein